MVYELQIQNIAFVWKMNKNICISIKISLKFVPEGLIDNGPALV